MTRWKPAAAWLAVWLAAVLAALGAAVALRSWATEAEIAAVREAVQHQARSHAPSWPDEASLAALPDPVRRWVAYTFPFGPAVCVMADAEMRGRFRRPGTDRFSATTARQRIAGGTPALAFDATTPVMWPVWARAYDGYVDGHMSMKVRVMSSITVVDEASTPELDGSSLRRWLLESAVCPNALLPGGPVRWEPIDGFHARAIVVHRGIEARLLATFDREGRLLQFDAESDGDLALPYHGSGERVVRSDDRLEQGLRVPRRFVVSRVAGAQVLPFWEAEVTSLQLCLAAKPR